MSLKFFEQYALCFLVWLGTAVGGAVLVVQGWQHIAALEHELNFANRKLAEERDLSTRQAAAMFDVGQRYDEVRGMAMQQAKIIDSCSQRDHRPIVIVDSTGRIVQTVTGVQ